MSEGFTEIGIGLSALMFGVLAICLRPQAVPGMPRMRLRVAALCMVAWAAAEVLTVRHGLFDRTVEVLLSLFVAGLWLWQLEAVARWQGQPRVLRMVLQGAGAVVLCAVLIWLLAAARTPWIPPPTLEIIALAGLALCVFGLFVVEQLYRNAPAGAEQAMRWLGLGVGGMLLTELVIFAEALLLGRVAVAPAALRGSAYSLCALAMLRGARLMPQWEMGLSVSRHVVFYAGSFVLIGGYLTLMALAGWAILHFANGLLEAAELVFAACAALGLGLALFSGRLFKRLKVLISTHFYPQRYDYRREWVRFTRTMSGADAAGGVPQQAIRALAQIVGSPEGCLWCSDRDSGVFRRSAFWSPQPVADARRELAPLASTDDLPSYLQRSGWLVDLAELARNPALYADLKLEAATLAVALDAAPDALIVPLLHVDQLYGWIVLQRAPELAELDYEDRDLLKIAGRHVAAHLTQLDTDARLAEARQFETYNRMTAFVMHDLKNIAAQLRLISQNAERHRRNPEFVEDTFKTVAAAAQRMTRLISQLTGGREAGTLQTLDLAVCAERAALRCSGNVPVPQVVAHERPAVFADMEHLTTVIEHAIRNAQEATPPGGTVRIEVGMHAGRPRLAVVDTGSGMDAQFVRERLFRPFDTTKGARGMGIGAYQIREYLRSLGGEVQVESDPGKGTSMTMFFAELPSAALARAAG